MSVSYGLSAYKNAITGLVITSLNVEESCQTVTALDEVGDRLQSDDYDILETVSIEATVNGTITTLVRNSAITVDSKTYKVRKVTHKKLNTGHYAVSLTAERWIARTANDTLTAPVVSGGSGSGTP